MFSVGRIIVSGFLLPLAVAGAAAQTNQENDLSERYPVHMRRAAEGRRNSVADPPVASADNPAVWRNRRQLYDLTRDDLKRIKGLLTPEREDVENYREFLEREDTGIFRLYPDFDCVSKGTVSVAGNCANQVFRGSTFSFRGSRRFSDVRYNNGRLTGNGFFSHQIFVDLGDAPIEGLNLDSPGVDFLDSFAPSKDFDQANRQFRDIVSGINLDGRIYSRSVIPRADNSYAVRIIAFDVGNSLQKRLWHRSSREPLLRTFQALQWDKRVDIVVVFRVIRLEEDGNITVVWKRLSRKKAPEITFGDHEPLKNFK